MTTSMKDRRRLRSIRWIGTQAVSGSEDSDWHKTLRGIMDGRENISAVEGVIPSPATNFVSAAVSGVTHTDSVRKP
jgi:hypothetical protein